MLPGVLLGFFATLWDVCSLLKVNSNFIGKLVMMHRPTKGAPSAPTAYDDYFARKTRRWELRLQGRFVRKPTGKLFAGVRTSS